MPVRTLQCPHCGADVKVGLPRDATVTAVAADGDAETPSPERKTRPVVCERDHEFYVTFTV